MFLWSNLLRKKNFLHGYESYLQGSCSFPYTKTLLKVLDHALEKNQMTLKNYVGLMNIIYRFASHHLCRIDTMESSKLIESVVKEAVEEVRKLDPDEFSKVMVSAEKKNEFNKIVKATAEEHVNLAKKLRSTDASNIQEVMQKHLSKARIEMIANGLNLPTYRMDVTRHSDDSHWVHTTRDGEEFYKPMMLATATDINWAQVTQYASIIVEAVLLVLSAVGIKADVDKQIIAKVSEEIVPIIKADSVLMAAVKNLKEVWNKGSAYEKAKAIFQLIKDSKGAGILWKIIKGVCAKMSTWQWIKTAGIVSAMIIAAIATDGVALIAKVVLALKSAYDFGKKLFNLNHLEFLETQI